MKITTKSGKRYMYLSQIKINLDIKRYDAKYDLEEREFGQLNQIINNFIGNNQDEIIKNVKPAIEELVSKRILLVSNDIVKHFTYEELFPDRT
jgi:inorganic pyrophosphatase/exopolyphosphatase